MNTKTANLFLKPVAGIDGVRATVTNGEVVSIGTSIATFVEPTKYVVWQAQTETLYVTFDGTTPSSSNGFSYAAGSGGDWSVQTAVAAKAIAASGTGYLMLSPFCD